MFGFRGIPAIDATRARLRTTLVYRFTDRFQAGVEYNPDAGDVGPLANLRVLDETEKRPALILGTSSDRIGTDSGRAVYATLSKNLEAAIDLPIAPYAGVSWSFHEDELLWLGGMSIFYGERFSSQHLFDGRNLHHVLNVKLSNTLTLGLVVAEQEGKYFPGGALQYTFGF